MLQLGEMELADIEASDACIDASTKNTVSVPKTTDTANQTAACGEANKNKSKDDSTDSSISNAGNQWLEDDVIDDDDDYFRDDEFWPWLIKTVVAVCLVLFFLYMFLVGLSLLGNSFKIIAGADGAKLFESVNNPLAGLMVGILATVFFQSSSTTTSIVVAAVGSLVLPVQQAIPMIFGANIGTSVTNTLVSLTFVKTTEHYKRGFAGATVHDMFNYINVAVWFPLELITSAFNGGNGGMLFLIAEGIAKSFTACEGECEKWEGPFKVMTKEISSKIIKVDKDVLKDISKGRPGDRDCEWTFQNWDGHYKFKRKGCSNFVTTDKKSMICPDTCKQHGIDVALCAPVPKKAKVSFTYCTIPVNQTEIVLHEQVLKDAQAHFDDFHLNKAGAFYDWGMDDGAAGGLALALSLVMITFSLLMLVKALSYILQGTAKNCIKKALNMNKWIAILVGIGITILVQSSSITTSTLTPLVAMGILPLDRMFAFTVGANIGTTCTGILASLVGSSPLGFQIAMVHFLFNMFGTLFLYPVEWIRNIPLKIATRLGLIAAAFRPFPIIYIALLFFIYPGYILLLSLGLGSSNGGLQLLGVIGLVAFVAGHAYAYYWFYYKNGQEVILAWIKRKDLKYKVKPSIDDENKRASASLQIIDPANEVKAIEDIESGAYGSGGVGGGDAAQPQQNVVYLDDAMLTERIKKILKENM